MNAQQYNKLFDEVIKKYHVIDADYTTNNDDALYDWTNHSVEQISSLLYLFKNQLNGKEQFCDAEKIIWELHTDEQNRYTIITSDYWINKDDIIEHEFCVSLKQFQDKATPKLQDRI